MSRRKLTTAQRRVLRFADINCCPPEAPESRYRIFVRLWRRGYAEENRTRFGWAGWVLTDKGRKALVR